MNNASALRVRLLGREVKLPGKSRVGGYIYVIRFADGKVKVGRTIDPRGRMGSHKGTARTFGVEALEAWFSPLHMNYEANESVLIDLVREAGGTTEQREFFSGVLFADAVAAAEGLTFESTEGAPDRQDPNLGAFASRAYRDMINDRYDERLRLKDMDAAEARPFSAHEWLSRLSDDIGKHFGRLPDGSYVLGPAESGATSDEVIESLAASLRLSPSDVSRLSRVDLDEMMVLSAVMAEAKKLREWASANGRADLNAPIRPQEDTVVLRIVQSLAS